VGCSNASRFGTVFLTRKEENVALTPDEYARKVKKEKQRKRAARYRERHPERVKEARERDYNKNLEKRRSAQKEYRKRVRAMEKELPKEDENEQ